MLEKITRKNNLTIAEKLKLQNFIFAPDEVHKQAFTNGNHLPNGNKGDTLWVETC